MKSYHHLCGVSKALDVVGERWTLLIVRDLIPGGRRYSDLLSSLGGITTNLLAKRLQHLEEEGIVEKKNLPAPYHTTLYELTERGRELEPVVFALGNFGQSYLRNAKSEDKPNVRWAAISLRRRYVESHREQKMLLSVVDHHFTYFSSGSDVWIKDGFAPDAKLSIHFEDERSFFLVVSKRESLEALLKKNKVRIGGSKSDLKHWCRSFDLLYLNTK